jgi:5-methylthioribose kinase
MIYGRITIMVIRKTYWEFPGGQEAFAEFRRRYIESLFYDTVSHASTKILRRMMGIVSVADTNSDMEKRLVLNATIQIGCRWALGRSNQKQSMICSVVIDEAIIGACSVTFVT